MSRTPLLFRSRSDEWPSSWWESCCILETKSALALHSRSLSSDPQKMSLNIDMKISRPLNCCGSLILFMNFVTSWTRCNVVNPGKYSTQISLAHNQLCPKVMLLWWIFHQSKINTSKQNFPSWLESLHKTHLIVWLSTFQICRTSVPSWDCSLYFWRNVNFPSNFFPMKYRCFQCWRHELSPD